MTYFIYKNSWVYIARILKTCIDRFFMLRHLLQNVINRGILNFERYKAFFKLLRKIDFYIYTYIYTINTYANVIWNSWNANIRSS